MDVSFCFRGVTNSKIGIWGQKATRSFHQDKRITAGIIFLVRVLSDLKKKVRFGVKDGHSCIH